MALKSKQSATAEVLLCMFMLDDEVAIPDALRRWAALYSLWKIGAHEEAQRLASSFVGCQANLCREDGEGAPVTLTDAYVTRDDSAPGGIAISFDWKRDGQYGTPTGFRDLVYLPEA
jgi:hypothetical protein